jgi:hypothetical protein
MLHVFISKFISIQRHITIGLPWKVLCYLIFVLIHSLSVSYSASISNYNHLASLSSSHQLEFMSNSSYRDFILRQYFIDLLNISHSSLVRSMIYDHHQHYHYLMSKRSIQSRRKARSHVVTLLSC